MIYADAMAAEDERRHTLRASRAERNMRRSAAFYKMLGARKLGDYMMLTPPAARASTRSQRCRRLISLTYKEVDDAPPR